MTSQNPKSFSSVIIGGVYPFRDQSIQFDFDPRINVFIGPNATGKSTILKWLAFNSVLNKSYLRSGGYIQSNDDLGLPTPQAVPYTYIAPVRKSLENFSISRSVGNHVYDSLFFDNRWQDEDNFERPCPMYDWRFSPDVALLIEDFSENTSWRRESFFSTFRHGGYASSKEDLLPFRLGPGTHLGHDTPYWSQEWQLWQSLLVQDHEEDFDVHRVYSAMEKLYVKTLYNRVLFADLGENENKEVDWDWLVQDAAYRCVQEICPEVIVGERPSDSTIRESRQPFDFWLEETITMVNPGTEFHTPDSTSTRPVHLRNLSTGTQGLYWWVWYLALKQAYYYDFVEDFASRPGLLFIDEIENHLHPTWQRRVIPALLKHFPGLQIFATTHSPFVVAGLKRGQIHALYREDGAVKVDKLSEEEKEERIEAWPVEDILRQFMEVYDPTDWATSIRSSALRWLRNRELNDEPAKDWLHSQLAHLGGIPVPERTRDEAGALVWLGQRRDEHPPTTNRNAYEWYEKAVEYLESVVDPDWEEGGPYAAGNAELLRRLEKMLEEQDLENRGNDTEG